MHWWAMGHQALAMEMEHLGRQWQLSYFCIAPHRFGSTVPRVYASVFTFLYEAVSDSNVSVHVII